MKYNEDDGEIWESIKKMDLEGVEHIKSHDTKKWGSYLKKTKNTICGRHAISIFLNVLFHRTL